jgi:Na+-driven multidrug efflux pump/anti-sigma regulatory factor (Ser/Thr protein kinase)
MLGQIVSTAIAGRFFDSAALSVIGVVLPVHYAYSVLGAVCGVGGVVVCGRLVGQREYEKAGSAFALVYLLIVALWLIAAAVLLPSTETIAAALGANDAVMASAREFIRVYAVGGVGVMLVFPAYNFLRFDGRNTAVMGVFFGVAALNILLDVVFLFIFRTGVVGIAYATVIGNGAFGLLGGLLLVFKSDNLKIAKPNKLLRRAKDIIVSGSPGAMEYFGMFLCALAINNLLSAKFGAETLGQYKIVDSMNSAALCVIWGVSGALTSFVGVLLAERDTKSIKQLLSFALKWGAASIVAVTVFAAAFARPVAAIFGSAEAESAVRIFALSLPLSMLNNIIAYTFLASKRIAYANIMLTIKLFAGVVLFAYPLSAIFGMNGIWFAFPAAEALALVFVLAVSAFSRRKNDDLMRIFLIDLSAEKNSTYKAFTVMPSPESIVACTTGIEEYSDVNGLSPKDTNRINLALEELLTVISARSEPENISVRMSIHEDIIILRFRDSGVQFDPVIYAKDADEEAQMDVMGILMILKLAINVDYRRTFGVNNTTIILRKSGGGN